VSELLRLSSRLSCGMNPKNQGIREGRVNVDQLYFPVDTRVAH